MTKEQIDALVKGLGRLGLGTNDGDAVHKPRSTGNDDLPMSVILISLYSIPHSILSSAPGRIDDKLRDISNRIEDAGYMGSNDGKAVPELMDEIRAAIANRQVSGKA